MPEPAKIPHPKPADPTADTNRYEMPEPQRWYALKVFYNRTAQALETIKPLGVETYVPTQTVVVERPGGQRTRTERPIVASLAFFRATESQAVEAGRLLADRAMVYSHTVDGQRRPAPIDDREMQIFRLVVSSGADGLEYVDESTMRFSSGDLVRVTAGPLAGAEGHIVRIRGDRRLVVRVKGVCAVATAYIPRCFLQPVSNQTFSSKNDNCSRF